MDFGIDTGFSEFDTELEDFEVRKSKTFVRGWDGTPGGSVASAPRIYEGVLYFGSFDHNVYAVRPDTGRVVWKTRLGERIAFCNPAFWKNLVIIGTYDKNLYAMRTENGAIKWAFGTGGKIVIGAAADGKKAYIGSEDGCVYALKAEDGKEVWRFRTGNRVACAPKVHGNKLICGSSDGNVYCLDKRTGRETWRFRTGDEIIADNPFHVSKGKVYVASFDNNVYALDIETGEEIWRFRTGKYGNSCVPFYHKEGVYHGSRDGVMYRIDAEKGKEVWRFHAGGLIVQGGVFNDRLYFGDEAYNFYCLDLDGKELWNFRTSGANYTMPFYYEGRIYFGSMDCHVYCLDAETGKEVWRFQTSDLTQTDIGEPYEMFEVVLKKPAAEKDEKEGEEKYEVNVTEGFRDEYESKNEYAAEITYQQKMKY